jgi:Ca2+-binding EF-hand superfamily protein
VDNLLHPNLLFGFQADVDGNGTIDYIEFITATMHMNRMEREDHLYKAFEYFDQDKSGYSHLFSVH